MGVVFNGQNEDGFFHAAGGGDDSTLLEYLNKPGFDINGPDSDGDTALFWASSRQRISTVRILLNNGADPNIVGVSGSPLRIAAALGNIELVDMLIDKGAIIDSDWSLSTPISMAMKQGQFDMVKHLLSRGANPNQASGSMNETPLMGAAMLGNLDLVRALINYGADVNRRDVDGDTAIVYLALGRSLNTQIAKELLLNGASIDDLYSHGCVFMRIGLDGSMEIFRREAVTRSVLYDDSVSLSMMNPQTYGYSDICY